MDSSDNQFCTPAAAPQARFEDNFAARRAGLLEEPLETVQQDLVAMASAYRVFREHCAACHGKDAKGQANIFPKCLLLEIDWTRSRCVCLWPGCSDNLRADPARAGASAGPLPPAPTVHRPRAAVSLAASNNDAMEPA